MPALHPRVLTIPPGAPFLETLVDALLDGALIPGLKLRDDPLTLADSVIYLPTRRAVRELAEVFQARLGGAALLPRIAPLGDVEQDIAALNEPADGPSGPQVVGTLERRLVLARLVRHWARTLRAQPGELAIGATASEALALAGELGDLIDSFQNENVPWERLSTIVAENYAAAWTPILDFLKIAAEWWPAYLAETSRLDPTIARNQKLAAAGAQLTRHPPRGAVIAAGSTGSIPATADLLAAISQLPRGAVVLPGLDQWLDAPAWAAVGGGENDARAPSHPQYGLYHLLARLGITREEVTSLGEATPRARLMSLALRPARTTDQWISNRLKPATLKAALAEVTLIEAKNEREEALTVAVALREALEEPGRTAALITPDRTLARGVIAELARWNISVEDSAGIPLGESGPGTFARLIAEAAANDLAPEKLTALLKHSCCHFGLAPEALRASAEALEVGVLRGPRPASGIKGLRAALAAARAEIASNRHAHPAKRALTEDDWQSAAALLDAIEKAFAPLLALGQGEAPFVTLVRLHRGALMAAGQNHTGEIPALTGEAGEALDLFLAELEEEGSGFAVTLAEFPSALGTLMQSGVVRPHKRSHPRLAILGLLEARLLNFDRVVLGGLAEGIWPPETRNDPWLSRPMRASLGLPSPERRLGLTAHDFEQAMGRADVVLTRALKVDGAPTVSARWLQRMAAVAGEDAWQAVRARGERLRALAHGLDAPERVTPAAPPLPRPPLELRPARLSVTDIEQLIRDPYAVYVKHILKLQPLDPIGVPPGASERGTLIHEALAQFLRAGHAPAAPGAIHHLLAIGAELFAPLRAFPDVHGLWWLQFKKIAAWFLDWEARRRPDLRATSTEIGGSLSWPTASGRTFTLSARADRIDSTAQGLAIVDYKTGSPPTPPMVQSGLSPQLTLEAAMAARGAFKDIPAEPAAELTYIRLTGGNPAGEEKPIKFQDKSPGAPPKSHLPVSLLADEALEAAHKLIDRFEDEATPYRTLVRPQFLRFGGEYRHLARVAEWGGAEDEDGILSV